MAAANSPGFCPYKGLQPYTADDREYFFGRERDREIIASSLYASPLTVFYGPSGVGKTSVLLAGVVPQLKEIPRIATVIFRNWQGDDFVTALKKTTLAAVALCCGEELEVDTGLELDEFLLTCSRLFRGHIFLILDQFDEYFLYHPSAPPGPAREGETPRRASADFEAELARAVNRREIPANFLLSLRDDGLSQLDRFYGRIPNLLSNILRLEHLEREAAERAIRGPLKRYNERLNGEPPVRVEDELVAALLSDLQKGKITLDATGQGQVGVAADESPDERVETPFLQVVLTRLWAEASADGVGGQRVLTLEAYERLGRAAEIVRTHLDEVMKDERLKKYLDTAAAVFHHLVTPSGVKIAHTQRDLVAYTNHKQGPVEAVLDLLSSPDLNILRKLTPPVGRPDLTRYEISHDVLAHAILDWRTRYQKLNTHDSVTDIIKKIEERLFQQPALRAESLTVSADIMDTEGTSLTKWRWDKYHVTDESVTRASIRGEIWFGPVSKIVGKPKLTQFGSTPKVKLKVLPTPEDYRCEYVVDIEGLLKYGDSLSYEIAAKVKRAFYMSKEDLELDPQILSREYWGYSILLPMDELNLSVSFPEGYSVKAHPAACFGEKFSENLLVSKEIDRLQEQNGFVQEEVGNIARLTVQHPTMGLSYFIYWDPPPRRKPDAGAPEKG